MNLSTCNRCGATVTDGRDPTPPSDPVTFVVTGDGLFDDVPGATRVGDGWQIEVRDVVELLDLARGGRVVVEPARHLELLPRLRIER